MTDDHALIQNFFSNPLAIQVFEMIELAYRYSEKCPKEFIFSKQHGFIKSYQPIPRGVYPVFNRYPEFVVNYKQQMREKIQKEEEEYMRQRKVQFDLSRLQDDLQRDKKIWGMLDWTVDDVLDKWWESMQADHEQLLTKKATLHSKLAEDKTASMKQVADARKTFIESQLQNTIHHLESVTKTMEVNRKQFESDLKQELMDRQLDQLQTEWEHRKQEMVGARKEIDMRERKRLERYVDSTFKKLVFSIFIDCSLFIRLLRNMNVIGMKRQELETELKNLDFKV